MDRDTGAGIADARVTAGEEETSTDRDGRFTVADTKAMTVLAPGYRPAKVTAPAPIRLAPFTPRALYLTSRGVGNAGLRDGALRLIDQGKANALVIDVKDDDGNVVYPSKVDLADTIGARTLTTIPDLTALARSLHDRGLYAIARIVVFKDNPLATRRQDLAVRTGASAYRDREGMAWTDPFRREVWRYNIAIAREAAEAGFDEVQFDYVRFPDSTAPLQFAQPSTAASRTEAVAGFLAEARKALSPLGTFTAADFFGYVCWNTTDTGIGQQLAALAGAVDYLSPMLYPSGFHAGIPGFPDPVSNTYQVVRLSLERAQARLGVPAVRFRPWLQAFRDYAFDRRTFDGALIDQQIRASRDFGANGWMLWNARNRYDMLDEGGSPLAAAGCLTSTDGKTGTDGETG